jgi:hypothetical protein
MSATNRSETIEIASPREACLSVLLNFENYPRWSVPILEAKVLESDSEGRGVRVAFALDMTIKTVRYTLAYAFELPERFSWKLVEGDISDVVGSYELSESAAGSTTATCEQTVDPGFWIPGPIRRLAESTALRTSLEELKKAVEAGN